MFYDLQSSSISNCIWLRIFFIHLFHLHVKICSIDVVILKIQLRIFPLIYKNCSLNDESNSEDIDVSPNTDNHINNHVLRFFHIIR